MSKEKKQPGIIASQLKELMESKGLTQKQVAESAKVSRQTVSKWLHGAEPGAQKMFDVAKANAVQAGFLFGGSEGPENYDLTVPAIYVNSDAVTPDFQQLLERLNKAVRESGKMSELAKYLGVPLASVSRWLAGKREPGGKITLMLLKWVVQQERK